MTAVDYVPSFYFILFTVPGFSHSILASSLQWCVARRWQGSGGLPIIHVVSPCGLVGGLHGVHGVHGEKRTQLSCARDKAEL